jgi:NarL family two-component system response regulator LiaR
MDLPLHECIRRIERSYAQARFLVLDHPQEKQEIARMLEVGAHGFLEQEKANQLFLRAVRLVANGHFWVPPDVLEMFLRNVAASLRHVPNGNEPLTPREQQILELVRKRQSNREIADYLRIRVATVKFHLSNILSKSHATRRSELFKDFHWDIWDKLQT